MNAQMTALKCLAAAAILALSADVAAACDDFDEEMTMAAAYDAAKLAQSQEPQPPAAQRAAASAGQTGSTAVVLQQPTGTAQR